MFQLLRKVFLFVAAVFVFSGCGLKSPEKHTVIGQPRQESETKTEEGWPKLEHIPVTLSRHIDGDTTYFLLNDEPVKVRYLLIDTPETVKKNTPVQPFGLEASKRTEELLSAAQSLTIMFDVGKEKDRYGRYLAYVFIDGELIQNTLIREGLAKIAYVEAPNTYFLDELMLSEEQAKKDGIGIWFEQLKE